jgi:hypothetical protein
MRRLQPACSLALMIALLAPPLLANTGQRGAKGFLPAHARVHGHTLTDLATAWNLWAFGTSEEVNPLLDLRCERSPIDPRIWFLPVSFGGETQATCKVPPGSFLFIMAGGVECSTLEEPPFYGGDEHELRACVEDFFEQITRIEVTREGQTLTDLDDYAVTTRPVVLPPNNLISPDPGLSLTKGYFLAMPPLSRGTHTVRAEVEFADGFEAAITYTIVVG